MWIVSALGLQRAGAVLVPINTRFQGHEARFILAKSQAKLLFTTTDFLGRDYPASLSEAGGGCHVERPVADLPDLLRVVTLSGEPGPTSLSWMKFLGLGSGITAAAICARAASVNPDDLSDILFTSGTTGNPKGACAHTVRRCACTPAGITWSVCVETTGI